MNDFRFEVTIALAETGMAEVVRERDYGGVRVTAEWPEDLAAPELRVVVTVRGDVTERDAPAYAELFFHDVFLILNLARPASFDGSIAIVGGRSLTFDARVFATAAPLATLPLADVARWYDGLRLGAQQLATDGVAKAIFHLLHLARGPEQEEESILRLAAAADALGVTAAPRLRELLDEIGSGRVAVIHPMHDDGLDPRVEDATLEWIEVADAAAQVVISALQAQVRSTSL